MRSSAAAPLLFALSHAACREPPAPSSARVHVFDGNLPITSASGTVRDGTALAVIASTTTPPPPVVTSATTTAPTKCVDDICEIFVPTGVCAPGAKAGSVTPFDEGAMQRLAAAVQRDCHAPPGPDTYGWFHLTFDGGGGLESIDVIGYSPKIEACIRKRVAGVRTKPFNVTCHEAGFHIDMTL